MYKPKAAANSLQSSPTLCDPIDDSPPGSPIPGILQARTLEWVAISFSNAWKWKVKVKSLSLVRLLATPWTAAYQTPPSMGFSSLSSSQSRSWDKDLRSNSYLGGDPQKHQWRGEDGKEDNEECVSCIFLLEQLELNSAGDLWEIA